MPRPAAQIDAIETRILDLPTIRGHVLSMTTMHVQTIVLVTLRFADGSIGLGEGTTIGGLSYGAESPESIRSAIDTYLAPILMGQDGDAVAARMAAIDAHLVGNPIARCAVETALWDAKASRLDLSVADLFGGPVRHGLPIVWTLASGDTARDIEEAEKMLEARRHRDFKLKIGRRDVREDVAHVAAIVRAVENRASVRVDVNQHWSIDQARWGLAALEEAGVTMAEQPVAATDLPAMADLSRQCRLAILADEALRGPGDAYRVARGRAGTALAVKVGQSGGLVRAREVMAIGQAAGLSLYGGTMLETGVCTAAAMQLFCTGPDLEWGCELFGPLLLTEDILAQPLQYTDFEIRLPDGPGIGVALDLDKVDAFDRERGSTLHRITA
ncbi:muconate cycloisomerase family protein [Jannaschia sp. 2305UL9-9]|uniref:muconate cycloisomerase family protein n=1 Tax=Jannaschia sp. 2305UL9-9 TaxID=3121638 RepID=UPI003527C053